jgi:pimeloyl-ACP methyl ester carboxylesterase/class 3 adenylate cyclase
MDAPEVRYAKSGDVSIAYSVVGDGPFDLIFVAGWIFSSLELAWDGPPADFFRRLASFSRLILFDKRGTGLSDRTSGVPDLETRADDIRAVMDAAGSKRAAIIGVSEGGPITLLFAATYPERTAAAILYGCRVSFIRSDEYPWALSREQWDEHIRQLSSQGETRDWLQQTLEHEAPSVATDEAVRRWWRRWVVTSTSPGAVIALWRMNIELDARDALAAIRVPALVVHRNEDKVYDVREARYIAQRIPGAELIELPGADHGWWIDPEQIAREIEAFLGGIWARGEWDLVESERVLATILFTDIVGATAKLAELGDRRWKELLQQHHAVVRRQLVRFSGREIDTAGDAFFASFDGPARAIRCACAITRSVRELGLDIRSGLHTGECELLDGKVGGIAVHVGARVAMHAAAGEVLVSGTVKDLVAGSSIDFHERGAAELKGIPGEWRLYSVDQSTAVD